MGGAIIGYLHDRARNNLDTKISNIESELLETKHELQDMREHQRQIQYEFSEYRRAHP